MHKRTINNLLAYRNKNRFINIVDKFCHSTYKTCQEVRVLRCHESVTLPLLLYNNYYMYILIQYNALRKSWSVIIPKEYKDTCLTIALEELSELQKEVCKLHRGKLKCDKLIKEIANVQTIIEWYEAMAETDVKEIETTKQQKDR